MLGLAKCWRCGSQVLATTHGMAYCPNCRSVFDPGISPRDICGRVAYVTKSLLVGGYRRELGLTKTGREWALRAIDSHFWNAKILHRKWAIPQLMGVKE
jgi:ribosomal protein S27AE